MHGRHLRLLSRAVRRTEIDQSRWGEVRRSKELVSRLITPFPAAASSTSCLCADLDAARHHGKEARATRDKVNFMVDVQWSTCNEVIRFPNGELYSDSDSTQESDDATGSFPMPSHALLLRLFLSPSFFSVHVALRYLLLYADNIGITYYLTGRLRRLDIHELRDVWGFVW